MSETNTLGMYFGDLPDPRVIGRCGDKLIQIIEIAICAVLSGGEGWEDIEGTGKNALQLVSVWASANGVLLGQRKVDDKSNEITAIPALLEQLYVAAVS